MTADILLIEMERTERVAIWGHLGNELIPFPERVNANFKAWVEAASRRLTERKRQDAASTGFTPEQLHWLEMIRDHTIPPAILRSRFVTSNDSRQTFIKDSKGA